MNLYFSDYPRRLRSYSNLKEHMNDLSIGIDFSIWCTLQKDLIK